MVRILVAALKALAFLLLTLPLMPLQAGLLRLKRPAAKALPQFYHRQLCRILRIQLHIQGRVPQAGLIVVNHASWLDIPVLSATARVSFVAKKEVSEWALFGTLARLQNTVFIDRKRRKTTGQSRNEMRQRLQAGDTLVLFPEGTSNNGRNLKPFKSTFFAAVENAAEVSLVPATLIYRSQHGLPLTLRQRPGLAWYGDMQLLPHLWAALKAGPIQAQIIFHDPLLPDVNVHNVQQGQRKQLAAKTEHIIREALAENLHARTKIS